MISTGKGKVAELKLHRENKEPAPKFRRRRNGARFILIICVTIAGYIAFSLGNQYSYLYAMQNNVETIQAQVEELRNKNAALREEINKIKSDAYVEQVAREQLGLVKPGETLVVPTQGTTSSDKKTQPSTPPTSGTQETFKVRDKNIYD